MVASAPAATAETSLLSAAGLRPGDEPAIILVASDASPQRISRSDLYRAAVAQAAGLVRLGVRPGDLALIAHTQELDAIYAFWGALLAGAIPSMFPTLTEKLDPAVYMDGMTQLAELSAARIVLTTADFAPQLTGRLACPVVPSAEVAAAGAGAAEFRPHPAGPDQIALLQHSSGTTGLQKGVALSHQAVLNQVAAYSQAIALAESDVIVSWLPLYHDMGLIAGFLLPLLRGVPLVLMSPFDWVAHPALLLRAIHDHAGTLCWLPNFAYNHCARRIRPRDAEGLSLASMRLFVNCSEPVRHDSHRLFLERFAANGLRPEMLAVSYAMAENTFAVSQTPPGRAPRLDVIDGHVLQAEGRAVPAGPDQPGAAVKVSCGPPIAGTQVRLLAAGGRPLAERQVGEIALRSDCMLSSYYRRPDLNPFRDGWYLTGDMGYLAGGELFVIGRSKELIINAGKNIYPQDIEAIVNAVPGVRPGRAVAFGVADEREGTELIAVVAEVTADDPAARQRIAAAIRQAVARQSMVSVSYVHLVGPKWLLKTSSGKIARGANRDKWLAETAGEFGHAPYQVGA
ncbi:MAG: AMP-binding protein [Candidatus Promineifilaceae bacterium]